MQFVIKLIVCQEFLDSLGIKTPSKIGVCCLERYRRGRNGTDSKSVWGFFSTWVRIPLSPPPCFIDEHLESFMDVSVLDSWALQKI